VSFLDPLFFLLFPVVYVAHLFFISRSTGDGLPRDAAFFLFFISLLFYAFYRPAYLPLLLLVICCAFLGGALVERARERQSGGFNRRFFGVPLPSDRAVMLATVVLLLSPLFVFKYYDFFLATLSRAGWIHGARFLSIGLPLGISFFTFQAISYVTDVYRRSFPASRSLLSVGLYLSFFPQLVAGPIVMAKEFLPQLRRRFVPAASLFPEAFFFLASGYLKKGVFADNLAAIVDRVYANPSAFGWEALLYVLVGYSLQIYFDFSGYSDIAIGLGKLFGIDLPENFNFPYSSAGPREFWRRWHITLSSWLRDHIYIPLGGSRMGAGRTVFALMATMVLGGLWHGAHWNFVLWGGAHGLLLALDRKLPGAIRKLPGIRQLFVVATFSVTSLLWVPFRAASQKGGAALCLEYYHRLFTFADGSYNESDMKLVFSLLLLLIVGGRLYGAIKEKLLRYDASVAGPFYAVIALLITLYAPGGDSFIYFVF